MILLAVVFVALTLVLCAVSLIYYAINKFIEHEMDFSDMLNDIKDSEI